MGLYLRLGPRKDAEEYPALDAAVLPIFLGCGKTDSGLCNSRVNPPLHTGEGGLGKGLQA